MSSNIAAPALCKNNLSSTQSSVVCSGHISRHLLRRSRKQRRGLLRLFKRRHAGNTCHDAFVIQADIALPTLCGTNGSSAPLDIRVGMFNSSRRSVRSLRDPSDRACAAPAGPPIRCAICLNRVAEAVSTGRTTSPASISMTASGVASSPPSKSEPPCCGAPGSHPISQSPMTRSGAASAISSARLPPYDVPTRINFFGAWARISAQLSDKLDLGKSARSLKPDPP